MKHKKVLFSKMWILVLKLILVSDWDQKPPLPQPPLPRLWWRLNAVVFCVTSCSRRKVFFKPQRQPFLRRWVFCLRGTDLMIWLQLLWRNRLSQSGEARHQTPRLVSQQAREVWQQLCSRPGGKPELHRSVQPLQDPPVGVTFTVTSDPDTWLWHICNHTFVSL